MNRLWKREYTLRASDFDKFNRIKPSAVLDLFQDAAGQHAEEIGVGFESMVVRSYLWVLTRVRFSILSDVKCHQTVTVKTWPLAPNKLNYRREYCIENEDGKRVVVGSSEWVVIHSEKRRFVSAPDLYSFSDGFCTEMMFEEKLCKIQNFEATDKPYDVNVGFSDLDANGHLNNTIYADYVMDAINPSKDDIAQTFQIDYRKEIMQGTKVSIYYTKEKNIALLKGLNENGDVAFASRIEFFL